LAASESPKEPKLKRDKSRDREFLGTVVAGKYKVLEILGQGGFGSVFVVEMTSGIIGDRLAMKMLPTEFSKNNMLREQFLNEIRVAMKMVDAHIVQIRDVGTTEGELEKGGGLLYYTMDYVDGKTLAQLIKQEGTLSIWRTLRIARRLLPALKVAHGTGIIHRDLKPANIMVEVVGEKEIPRILDFGIATAVISDTKLDNSLEGGLKGKKGFVGSPYYMPPEQFQGVEMGFYTDLYSLGVIIYECLTGQKPYTGRTAKEVYKKIKQGPPIPVDELQPSVGKVPGLTEMVMKSLERNPEKRFQSAKEFFESLTKVMSGKSEEAAPAKTKKAVAPKPRIAARHRTTGIRKSAAGSALRDRLPTRRKSNLGGIILVLLALGATGMLAFVFKDQLLDAIKKSGQGSGTPPPVAGKTPGTGQPRTGPSGSQPATPEQKNPEPANTPPGQKPPGKSSKTSTSERMQEVRERLAERIRDHLQAGATALARKEWNTASGEADSVLEIQADHAAALLLRAQVMLNTNRSVPAISVLGSALKTTRDTALRIEILRHLAIGHTSLQQPDWNTAAKHLEQATSLDPENAPTARMLILAYQELRQEKRLAAFVRRAHEAGNKDSRVAELFEEIWVLTPQRERKELEEQTALALRLYSEQDYLRAARAAEKTLGVKPSVEMAEIALDSYIRERRYSEASGSLDLLEELLERTPEADDSFKLKLEFYDGKVSYLKYLAARGSRESRGALLQEAELKLSRTLNSLAGKKTTELYYQARSWRGLVYASRRQLDGVISEFQAARSSRDPRLIDLHARTYLDLGSRLREPDNRRKAYDLAKGRLLNLLKLSGLSDNRKATAYYKLGVCYLEMGKLTDDDADLRKAANRFLEAKKKGYDSPGVFEKLGETYRNLGEFIKAAVHYRDAYYKAPSPSRCLTAVSHFLQSNPRAPQAKELLVHALQKFPGDKGLLSKQRELE
jgi:serine/threonine-protein kinase